MSRRIYRAIAKYADPTLNTTRHFLTKRSRDSWAKQRREGYPAQEGTYSHLFGDVDEGRPAIPPATTVEIADSGPVTFLDDSEPTP